MCCGAPKENVSASMGSPPNSSGNTQGAPGLQMMEANWAGQYLLLRVLSGLCV